MTPAAMVVSPLAVAATPIPRPWRHTVASAGWQSRSRSASPNGDEPKCRLAHDQAFWEQGPSVQEPSVLEAGATGAVGRTLLPRLLTAGHQVVGTTRTEAKAARIRALGGTAVVADGLDAEAMRRAVATTEPDVIVHEMTNLKGASDLRH